MIIYDPSQDDSLGALRGGGRIVRILRENLTGDVRFVSDLSKISANDTLLIPLWRAFQPPLLNRRIADKQILILFDVIPLKYPEHFPIGLKGRLRLMNNIRSLKVYDRIITISEHAKNDIVEYLSLDPNIIDVVYPTTSDTYYKPAKKGITISTLNEKYGIPKSPFCTYVGDTNWNKNLVNTALAIMKADVPCVFIGNTFSLIRELRAMDEGARQDYFSSNPVINHPEQREFKEFVKLTLHDENHFIFPGFIPDEEMVHIYQHSMCNVYVSRDEGFGLIYLEASTQKCPSVLADNEIFHETAGKAALFAQPELPEDIAEKILTLFKQKKTREKLGKDAYKWCQRFAPGEFGKSMLSALAS